jgi:PAS domain S-box-containing protein
MLRTIFDALLILIALAACAGIWVILRRYHTQIERLKQQDEQLRKLSRAVEQSANTIMITDLAGNIEYVNPKFTALTGYTLDEVRGQNPRFLKSGHTSDAEYADMWRTISAGHEWHGEFLNKKKNGELYWEWSTFSPIKDAEGRVTHYLAVKEDITARKAAEEKLTQSEARQAALLAAIPDLVFRFNRDGQYLDVRGDPMVRIRAADEPLELTIGKTLADFLPEPVAHLIHGAIRDALDTGEIQCIEYQLDTLSGPTDFEARIVALGPDEVTSVARDITARKQAEAERERLIHELDAFSHTVAHDLKNPLQGIIGYASLLAGDSDRFTPDELARYLTLIEQYGYQMTAIINELLLLASVRKLDEINTQPVYMTPLLKSVLSRLDFLIQESSAQVVMLSGDWPVARGYAPWIEEVWANYISNAIKYGGQPPRVELGADRLPDSRLRFWVRDNGQGIPPEKRAKLFAEFTRLEYQRVEGHGLGLSIVRRIMDKLGGDVGVDSTIGEGSVFSFILPEDNEDV